MRATLAVLGSLTAMIGTFQGCGSSAAQKPDAGNPDGAPSTCTVTLNGGVVSVHSCAVTFAYDGTVKATDFSLSTTNVDTATVPNLYASIQIAGNPARGSFLSTNPSVLQGLLAVSAENSTDAWSADSATTNTALTGTFALTITDVGVATSVNGSSFYTNTHGTLDSMLVPVTVGQTTDAIDAHASF